MMKEPIETILYKTLLTGIINGKSQSLNDFDLSQYLMIKVTETLLSNQQKDIYAVMTSTPMKAGEIGKKCGLPSKNVSTILIKVSENYPSLVSFKSKGRLKLWYKKESNA